MKTTWIICSLLTLSAGAAAATDSPWDGTWKLDVNNTGVFVNPPDRQVTYAGPIGTTGAKPVVGDWTGAGVEGLGLYDDGIWYLAHLEPEYAKGTASSQEDRRTFATHRYKIETVIAKNDHLFSTATISPTFNRSEGLRTFFDHESAEM